MPHHATIFGYGTQGRSQALNLRDSGWVVTVALRPESRSLAHAQQDGMTTTTDLTSAARTATLVALLITDQAQAQVWSDILRAHLPTHATLLFAHGYAVHYRMIEPRADLDIVLAGPMCPGSELRERYLTQQITPIIRAVHQDTSGRARERLDEYIAGITGNHSDLVEATFAEETETDLFSEQALLCGGLGYLVKAVYDIMRAAGYNEKLAFYTATKEPVNLARLIADHGVDGMFARISATARYGAQTRGPRVIDAHVRTTLQQILREIQDGRFATELEGTAPGL